MDGKERAERLQQMMDDPALRALYQQLAEEDTRSAEEGIADWYTHREEADRA